MELVDFNLTQTFMHLGRGTQRRDLLRQIACRQTCRAPSLINDWREPAQITVGGAMPGQLVLASPTEQASRPRDSMVSASVLASCSHPELLPWLPLMMDYEL